MAKYEQTELKILAFQALLPLDKIPLSNFTWYYPGRFTVLTIVTAASTSHMSIERPKSENITDCQTLNSSQGLYFRVSGCNASRAPREIRYAEVL